MATRKSKAPTRTKPNAGGKEIVQPTKTVGRPPAKHSSPDYVQMSIYVHKDVRRKVKVRLFEAGGEFSGLVESFLRDWLANEKRPRSHSSASS